jgi:large subunit ribosomal protein L30
MPDEEVAEALPAEEKLKKAEATSQVAAAKASAKTAKATKAASATKATKATKAVEAGKASPAAKTEKAPATERRLVVTQIKSSIGTKPKHRGTLRALGLGRIGKSNVLPDRPEIRGMIARVPHLISITEEQTA